jgi:Fe-S-cluster containining protein
MDKASALRQIYAFHQELAAGFETACKAGCAACCTDQLAATTLEAGLVKDFISANNLDYLLKRLPISPAPYQPDATFNTLAGLCLNHKDLPESRPQAQPVACPLLNADNTCPIYPVRPFACRAMLSALPCAQNGHAEMDSALLTINEIFCQVIEHLDQGGFYGNLLDMIKPDKAPDRSSLLQNRPIPGLIVAPEHQNMARPIVQRLWGILG